MYKRFKENKHTKHMACEWQPMLANNKNVMLMFRLSIHFSTQNWGRHKAISTQKQFSVFGQSKVCSCEPMLNFDSAPVDSTITGYLNFKMWSHL